MLEAAHRNTPHQAPHLARSTQHKAPHLAPSTQHHARIRLYNPAVMQVIRPPKVYPVVVVGSGASGGMAAWNLTRQGINVVLLDAGTKFDRSKYWTHVRPWEARAR